MVGKRLPAGWPCRRQARALLCRLVVVVALMWAAAPSAVRAQEGDFRRLFELFRNVSRFDFDYPREKVFLHLDNNAYMEGDTLWYKASVVRASSLLPEPLSRVLYVELLGADGRLVERNLLRLDSAGCASGEFLLQLPVRRGFYEIRAYTRAMTNWGAEACFSRVVPVFSRVEGADDNAQLDIYLPSSESELPPAHPRPFPYLESRGRVHLDFYPESGNRVAGLSGFVAFKLTDERGKALDDVVRVVAADGTAITEARPRHDGMGKFLLPADAEGAYALVGNSRFELPAPTQDDYAMTVVRRSDGGHDVTVQKRPGARERLLGLLVTCREQVCYFDTLTVTDVPVCLELDAGSLHGGVNRLELYDVEGRSLCRRLVWKKPEPRNVSVEVRQNAATYDPFSPVALEVYLKDREGKPVQAHFSLSVRDRDGHLAQGANETMETDLLLSSELKGYVHDPSYYFDADDPARREALDLLLMVQGWTANPLGVMTGADTFRLKQPLEEKLTLNGYLYRDKDDLTPMADATLSLKMFSREGGALEGTARPDSTGYFAFESNLDFCGDWIAQFTTYDKKGRRRWSRVTLDRWFDVPPRPYAYEETTLSAPLPAAGADDAEPLTFEWTDTIPRYSLCDEDLAEAVVQRGKRYWGLTGGRYSFNGGEQAGMQKADVFYNIEREVEMMKDRGEVPGTIWGLLARLDNGFDYDRSLEVGYTPEGEDYAAEVDLSVFKEPKPPTEKATGDKKPDLGEKVTYHNRTLAAVFLNNYDKDVMLDEVIWAEEIKSAVLMHGRAKWQKFCSEPTEAKGDDALFLYSRPDYVYFQTKRGTDKRMVQGYSQPRRFYAPQYNGIDLPAASDLRRTLYWNPDVRTDAAGKASAVFFSNAREQQRISISIRGITSDGAFIDYER